MHITVADTLKFWWKKIAYLAEVAQNGTSQLTQLTLCK